MIPDPYQHLLLLLWLSSCDIDGTGPVSDVSIVTRPDDISASASWRAI